MGAIKAKCTNPQLESQIKPSNQNAPLPQDDKKSQLKLEIQNSKDVQNPQQEVIRKEENKIELTNSASKTISTTASIVKYCVICKKSIGSDLFEASCCKQAESDSYHLGCLEKSLQEQINKGKHLLKFKCGTIVKSIQLRNSGLHNRMNLLCKLFDKQVEHCLTNRIIRKDDQLMEYCQKNRPGQDASDYFFINQELLEYEETPQ